MILLSKAYKGYAAGTVVQFITSEEASLVTAGLATVTTLPITAGNVTANTVQGRAAVAAGATSIVITNNLIDAGTKIFAAIAQAVADATATTIASIVPAAGSVTITMNAAATANTVIDWSVLNPTGTYITH
jgi:hypothetical protein